MRLIALEVVSGRVSFCKNNSSIICLKVKSNAGNSKKK